jgi:ribosome-binding protein aMBF1 (putative translation factor)
MNCQGWRLNLMLTFDAVLQKKLQDPVFKKEYDALEPEYQVIRAVIENREKKHLSQQELANKIGIDRANLSKLENGNANPSIQMLKRIASALNMRLKIEFLPR